MILAAYGLFPLMPLAANQVLALLLALITGGDFLPLLTSAIFEDI